MKVSDILRVKGNTLYTVHPDDSLLNALNVVVEKDRCITSPIIRPKQESC